MLSRKKILIYALLIAVLPLGLVALSILSSGKPPAGLASDGRLSPCPDSPNCVCSETDGPLSSIAALAFSGSPETARASLLLAIENTGGTVQREDADYLWATYQSSLFRFTDDLECRVDASNSVIHIRSASRSGHSDMGANRRRAEQLRAQFIDHQATQP
ncbi:MAG: hypothetical protein ACI8W8_001403 [Rhodothermales bacterium]|jgi:uncharacterized protein (DUF1499 family)